MSDTYFRKMFFKVYGKTPLHYINTLRIERAKALLSESGITLEQVAIHSGFSDVKYFSSVFKSYTGISPSKYR